MKKTTLACMGLVCSIFWAACSGKKAHFSEYSAADSSAGASRADTAFTGPKLVKTAGMRFKVNDVRHVAENISALTLKYKGMVMHHTMGSTIDRSETVPQANDSVTLISSYNTNANMVVKVPVADVDVFLNEVGKMAVYVNNRNMDIEDKSLDYLSAQMKLVSRSQFIDQQKKGIIKVKDPAAVMDIKDDLIDKQIDNKRIDYAVKYSTVGLNFYQSNTIAREVIVNDDPAAYKLPFFTRLGYAFVNGWAIFNDELISLATLWVFILGAIALWMGFKHYKRKAAIATI